MRITTAPTQNRHGRSRSVTKHHILAKRYAQFGVVFGVGVGVAILVLDDGHDGARYDVACHYIMERFVRSG